MNGITRRCWLGAIPLFGLLMGCKGPLYFATVMLGKDPREQGKFAFPEASSSEPTRLAVITYVDLNTQLETGHFDHELTQAVAWSLAQGFQREKRKDIEVIRADVVSKWQDEHPDWHSIGYAELGKALVDKKGRPADYVLTMEVERLSFYPEGSSRTLLQGRAEIHLFITRVDDDQRVFEDNLSIECPHGRQLVASEHGLSKFRREFIAKSASVVNYEFLPHESHEDFSKDPM
jgi:hypothetical protein